MMEANTLYQYARELSEAGAEELKVAIKLAADENDIVAEHLLELLLETAEVE